jgi:ubiquinone/menaquinone biosynthesis C-methylase UbiE
VTGRPFARDFRRPVLDLIGPAYLLDENYRFLDWNVAFEEAVARELGLQLGNQALAYVRCLEDADAVLRRALETFTPASTPLTDMEPLRIRVRRWGLLEFQKFAAQIHDENGDILGWCVALNVLRAEKGPEFWACLEAAIEGEAAWARYALSFDEVFALSEGAQALLEGLCEGAKGGSECLHLGTGTGLALLRHLERSPGARIWALESNETMLEILRGKLSRGPAGAAGRLTLVKGRARELAAFSAGHFDSCVVFDGHYRADDFGQCLSDCRRVLKDDGVLSLASFTRSTDFDGFFAGLERSPLYEKLRPFVESYRDSLGRLGPRLRGLSRQDLEGAIKGAGFDVARLQESPFQGGCVSILAVKARAGAPAGRAPRPGPVIAACGGGTIDLESADLRSMLSEIEELRSRLSFPEDLKFLLEDPAWERAGSVLDLACGCGHFTAGLARYFPGKRFTGLDEDRGFAERARERYGRELSNASFEAAARGATSDRGAAGKLRALGTLKEERYERRLISSMGPGRSELFMDWFLLAGAMVRRQYGVAVDLPRLREEFLRWKQARYGYGHWSLEYLLLSAPREGSR